MNLVFSPQGWEDYQHWQETDRKIVKRINLLIKDTIRRPTDGIGKPEPLRHALAGYWFRRITAEHRFVYKVVGDDLRIAQLRYHYEKSEPNPEIRRSEGRKISWVGIFSQPQKTDFCSLPFPSLAAGPRLRVPQMKVIDTPGGEMAGRSPGNFPTDEIFLPQIPGGGGGVEVFIARIATEPASPKLLGCE